MSTNLTSKYPHLSFRKNWELTKKIMFLLGQCEAIVSAIRNAAVLPNDYTELMTVSLTKGAQATTAIEGNSLSFEEIEMIQKGEPLPPSKEYQQKEVQNILHAYNILLNRILGKKEVELITPEFLLRNHKEIGKNLSKYFNAIPGRFREDNRVVGTYRCPDYQDVPKLVQHYCEWLKTEFHFDKGQEFFEYVVQAIVAHVYLEWIHPFGDGNGRCGRLVEYYILLRGGIPNVASHILSTHYNLTRPEYYTEISNATKDRSLTNFIEYALIGFRDGLVKTLQIIQKSQLKITWQKYVYDQFSTAQISHIKIFKRRRRLALEFLEDEWKTLEEIAILNERIATQYRQVSNRTIMRDLDFLVRLEVLVRNSDTKKFKPMTSKIKSLQVQSI